jgi:hypothetical protein
MFITPSSCKFYLFIPFRLTAITLSETGNIMVCGFQDSSIKVFVFDIDALDIITQRDI